MLSIATAFSRLILSLLSDRFQPEGATTTKFAACAMALRKPAGKPMPHKTAWMTEPC
jgi:hypothetical protein